MKLPKPSQPAKPLPPYDHLAIESKWQKQWTKKKVYATKEQARAGEVSKKFYVLDMFPYPSGEGLHVGHPKGYIATDVVSRMKRMQGHSVLHPMGFDAFGLPAENYAIKMKTNPAIAVEKNVQRYKEQLEMFGFDYDWSREINTTDPAYYKWTQWIFLKLLEKGLAYESHEPINWCPSCKTGLANEDLEDGKCERCGSVVEKKPIRQWVLKITDYAERLLADLDATEKPLMVRDTGPDAVRTGMPLEDRNAVVCVVKHWSEDKFLCLRWKSNDWHGLVVGGVEKGEQLAEAAVREVQEETGYQNVRFVREFGKLDSQFYQAIKKVNRFAHFTGVYLELTDDAWKDIDEKEKALHEVVWLPRAEVVGFLNRPDMNYLWDVFTGKEKNIAKPALDWPTSIKELQRNWIGKSEGVNFNCKIKDLNIPVQMYNSVPQTYHAETFTVIAPDHPLVKELVKGTPQEKAVLDFAEAINRKKAANRFDVESDMEGIFTGRYIESFADTGRDLPIWVASYVVSDYGTGIVNASAHDERDFAFAKKFNIPLRAVMLPEDPIKAEQVNLQKEAYVRDPQAIIQEPAKFKGRRWAEVRADVIEHIVKSGFGTRKVNYRLRDWVFSRQRYWGEPIPVVHCEKCGVVPVPEKELPVKLPKVKSYEPTGTGESPLAAIEKWVNTKCPKCVAEKGKTKYFIFDFDGVLADTWKASLKTRIALGVAKDEIGAAEHAFKYFDEKPNHTRSHNLRQEDLDRRLNWTIEYGKILRDLSFELFNDFIAEVKKIKGAKYAVVSSGSQVYIQPALKRIGLKFSHVLALEEHHSKEEKIEHICKDWGVDVKDVYYFTDTKADVYELENFIDPKKIIGCAWGYCGYEKLAQVLPSRQILKDHKDIHRIFNPKCDARRETNTMPQWAGSSWYYLRYMDVQNKKALVDPRKEQYWAPVDLYVGGAEHATRHLIYARFWHKFLYDIGVVSTTEPFKKLQHVGLIMAEDGRKMSKRWGNVVNPDEIIGTYGADTLRVYEMFMGPFDQQIAWNTNSMIGSRRFLERVWKLAGKVQGVGVSAGMIAVPTELESLVHKTVKKVSADIADMKFNTAISTMMILLNALDEQSAVLREHYEIFLKLLAPFAPHMSEELWAVLGNKTSIHLSAWPVCDEAKIREASRKIGVQVNGKIRAEFEAATDASDADLQAAALALPEVKKWTDGKTIAKVIVVKGKLVSVVLGS